jgi:hypothetical protein
MNNSTATAPQRTDSSPIEKPRIPSYLLTSAIAAIPLTALFYLLLHILGHGTYIWTIFSQRGSIPYMTTYLAFAVLVQLAGLFRLRVFLLLAYAALCCGCVTTEPSAPASQGQTLSPQTYRHPAQDTLQNDLRATLMIVDKAKLIEWNRCKPSEITPGWSGELNPEDTLMLGITVQHIEATFGKYAIHTSFTPLPGHVYMLGFGKLTNADGKVAKIDMIVLVDKTTKQVISGVGDAK